MSAAVGSVHLHCKQKNTQRFVVRSMQSRCINEHNNKSNKSALTYYAENGWVEVDNNIAENALRLASLGRKSFLFFGSDHGGERVALLYSLLGTCRLNRIDPDHYLQHVLNVIADWPVNRVSELLPWRVALPAE